LATSETYEHHEYKGYKGLPSLAGYCSLEEATCRGLSVDECVRRLKRYHYAFKRLHEIMIKRLTAEPIYELKMAFSLHAYLCAEHVGALRTRVAEMRQPPLGLEEVPDGALELFFDEILATPSAPELVAGIYGKALPALAEGMRRHLDDTNHLADAPTVRLCKLALVELAEMNRYGAQALSALVDPAAAAAMTPWTALLGDCLAAAGGLDGVAPPVPATMARLYSATPFVYDRIPQRDARFSDNYNRGVNAEAFVNDTSLPAQPKVLMLYFKRLREIDVPEMMASIIAETHSKPWQYYLDMTRQLWDEARHALMGEVGFVSMGLDWPTLVRPDITWSLGLNTKLTPKQRHAVLWFIEQGLMPKTGKRYEWEVAQESGNALSMTFQDYDWADEVLHARIGRDWYVEDMPSQQEALAYGDRAWSHAVSDWTYWKAQGLTEHANWWPDLYRAACERWGVEPDPVVLAFDTSYGEVRSDLKSYHNVN
jgi:hypothetical protein